VVYNVPGRTVTNIAAQTCLTLAREVDNIVGTKEASGDFSQIMAILAGAPEGFAVLSGDDATTLPLVALGAHGVVSVASNQAPRLMSDMVDAALAGRWDEARRQHYRLLPLMEGNFIETSPAPVKAALTMMGLIEENLRLPLVPVTDETRAKMRGWLEDLELV
jgi:4-hydroxy-tetrahydrodipicolinate synthase